MEDVLLVVGVIALGLRREGVRFTPSLRVYVCVCERESFSFCVCVCVREREREREGCRVSGLGREGERVPQHVHPLLPPLRSGVRFQGERGKRARERAGLRVSGRHQPSFPGVWLRGQGGGFRVCGEKASACHIIFIREKLFLFRSLATNLTTQMQITSDVKACVW